MKCCIVKDLLPGYIDGLTSEETNEEMKMHLESCNSCNTIYRQMAEELPIEIPPEKTEIDFLKKLKASMHRKYVIVALSTCAILIGTTVFLKRYEIPVSYAPDCMTTELYKIAYVPNSRGLREWVYVGPADGAGPEDTDDCQTMEQVRFVLNLSKEQQRVLKINDFTSNGRTIRRNGKTVRVVYYCYTRTLWNSLLEGGFIGSTVREGEVFEENFYRNPNADYQPLEREIYYLPMGNMDRLDRLSDEEFDAKREEAELVWSGVI